MDGSPLGTVGPKKKPICKLDSVSMALERLEKGMVMTKIDDKVVSLLVDLSLPFLERLYALLPG